MLKDIVEKPIDMKPYFTSEASSLLKGLLERNPVRRLGSSTNDASDIMGHPFFRDINWKLLREKKVDPPYKPYVTSNEDTRNIDKLFTQEEVKETPQGSIDASTKNKT